MKHVKQSTQKKNGWPDHFSRLAKKENYPARSVYKLKEIQKKYHIIKKGDKVLDLGCSPGSWLLFAAQMTGPKGSVVGIDLKAISIPIPSNVSVFTDDIFSLEDKTTDAMGRQFNVVLSDMAPATTGRKDVDAARSFRLCVTALTSARELLAPGGSFLCKIFQGEDFQEFVDAVATAFHHHHIFKPQSSRKPSKEIYVIGLGKK